MPSQGKLIVLEGIDGSGKATQTLLLSQKLEKDGYSVKFINFPQYGQKSAGMIENYLKEQKYGPSRNITSYQAAIFYAIDRFDAKGQLYEWLESGNIILCDRYVGSNLAHQGCKIKNNNEREEFFAWVENLEYNIFGIPRPDVNIILKIDPEKGQELARKDSNGKDLHEDDLDHLKSAAQIYSELVENKPDFISTDCMQDSKLLSLDEISKKIYKQVSKYLNGNNP